MALSFRAKVLLAVLVEYHRAFNKPPTQRELFNVASTANEGVRGYGGLINDWYIRTGAVKEHPFGLTGEGVLSKIAHELSDAGLLLPRSHFFKKSEAPAARQRLEGLRDKIRNADENVELMLLEAGLKFAGMPYTPTSAGFKYADEHLAGDWQSW